MHFQRIFWCSFVAEPLRVDLVAASQNFGWSKAPTVLAAPAG